MKSYVKPYQSRREVGFYIYYVKDTQKFWVGDLVIGPEVGYDDYASMSLGVPSNSSQVCGFFHCHTPYYGPTGRSTGPSEADIEAAEKSGLPGIVYDYPIQFMTAQYWFEYDNMLPEAFVFGPERRKY